MLPAILTFTNLQLQQPKDQTVFLVQLQQSGEGLVAVLFGLILQGDLVDRAGQAVAQADITVQMDQVADLEQQDKATEEEMQGGIIIQVAAVELARQEPTALIRPMEE